MSKNEVQGIVRTFVSIKVGTLRDILPTLRKLRIKTIYYLACRYRIIISYLVNEQYSYMCVYLLTIHKNYVR